MPVTLCLGTFALRISRQPKAKWKAEIDRLPESCPHGCKVHCRQVCAEYARVQWKAAELKKRFIKPKQFKATNKRGRDAGAQT